MLYNTFVHIPGIGRRTELAIWEAGIRSWEECRPPFPASLSPRLARLLADHVEPGRELFRRDPRSFASRLGSSQSWRLFPALRHNLVYLDIETTGLDREQSEITTIALYDGVSVFTFVRGENLDAFPEHIRQYEAIVTFNGSTFDLPFLERSFDIRLRQVHIDLRYVLRDLGFSGGLKRCERQLGIDRGELDGVDGFFAVLLWREYRRTGDRRVLDTLLAYNVEDTVNLEPLMVQAYNLQVERTPFAASHRLPPSSPTAVPFTADPALLNRLRPQSGRW